jgi:hypothetical protein
VYLDRNVDVGLALNEMALKPLTKSPLNVFTDAKSPKSSSILSTASVGGAFARLAAVWTLTFASSSSKTEPGSTPRALHLVSHIFSSRARPAV